MVAESERVSVMRPTNIRIICFLLLMMSTSVHAQKSGDITISHSPASFAIKGQSLTLRAKVTGGSGGIDSVTLYYALFRDAAPFRVAMTSSGMDLYVGTIEAGLLSGLPSVSYYIEAQDRGGSMSETPWYDVQFRDPEAPPAVTEKPAAPKSPAQRTPSRTSVESDDGISGTTMALIAGGAVALGAGAYLIADGGSGGGGGDDDGGGSNTNLAATYKGTARICEVAASTSRVCKTESAEIFVDANGNVFSTMLLPGTSLSAPLDGNTFVLSGNVNDSGTGTTGTILFKGVIGSDGVVIGEVFGDFVRGGSAGEYDGYFTLNKSP